MEMMGYLYRCSAGESFDGAARILYDDEKYAAELMSANPEESDKMIFEGGEMLRIPYIDIPEPEEGEIRVAPEKAPWKE